MGIIRNICEIIKNRALNKALSVDCDSITVALLPSDIAGFAEKLRLKDINLKTLAKSDPFTSEVCIINAESSSTDKIVSLFKSLPKGELNRCFVPSYRVEFLKNDVITKVAVICWRGNQIKIYDGNKFSSYNFDGSAVQSIKLLSILREQVAIQI